MWRSGVSISVTAHSLKSLRQGQPHRERLHRMQHIVHYAVLADGGQCLRRLAAYRKPHGEQALVLEERAVGIFGLGRSGVEQIEAVELDAPAVGEAIADPA